LFAIRISADGDVSDEDSADTGLGGARECVCSRSEDRIEITEQNDGHRELRALYEVENAVVSDSVFERALRAGLNDRSIGDWIREWDT
jgi:hypothetical protein